MLKRNRIMTVLAGLAATVVAGAALQPAHAGIRGSDDPGEGSGTETSGQGVTVSVTGSLVNAGSSGGGGGGGSTTVQVPVPCWYSAGKTGKEYYKWVESGEAAKHWHRTGGRGNYSARPGYKQHKKDTKGHWYGGVCSSETFGDDFDAFSEYSTRWHANHDAVYVEAGESPPVPDVPAEVLLQAAQEALSVPDPRFGMNPRQGGEDATLVNLSTWFWIDSALPRSGSVTATAGSNSATVELQMQGVEFSSPTDSVTCPDGGSPYQAGASSGCTLEFRRASDATEVTAETVWEGSWSFNGAVQGAVEPIGASWSQSVAVNEVQSVVTAVD